MASGGRVYVVDDDDAVRDSLAAELAASGFMAATFVSGRQFLEAAPRLARGCVIADLRMPDLDGLALLARLAALRARFPVIVMTGHGDVETAVQAMKAGAVDFVEKPFSPEAILESLREARLHLEGLPSDGRNEAAASHLAQLTQRERDVLKGLVAGLPNKTIAYDLGISPRTVEIYRSHVMEKMRADSLAQLVHLALAAGMRPDD